MEKCVAIASKAGMAGVCGLFLALAVAPAKANTLTFTGDTDGTDQTWTRPTVNLDPPTYTALVGGGQGWVAQEFSVDTTGTYTYSSVATGLGIGGWGAGTEQDIVGFLYENTFDSTDPLTNVLLSHGGAASWSATLTAGTNYFVVVTGFCGTASGSGTSLHPTACAGPSTLEEGPFSASITGPGTITAGAITGTNVTPEPSSIVFVGTGLSGLLAAIRRRKRRA